MSRCFPFPPPGYETRARPDDVSLIIKEKHKNKKNTEKKDKGKKARSERKEKQTSKGEHKEDKDPKQKHRDKKERNKDKQRSLEEKKISVPFENQNDQKLGPDSKQCNGIRNCKGLVEIGKRVRNDSGVSDDKVVHKITLTEQRKANLPGVVESSDDLLAEAYGNIKNKREHTRKANGESLEVDARSLGNALVEKFFGENHIKFEEGSWQLDKGEKTKYVEEKSKIGSNVDKEYKHQNGGGDENGKAEDKKKKKVKKKKVMVSSEEKIKPRVSGGSFSDFGDNNLTYLQKASHDNQGKLPKHKEPVSVGFQHAKDHGHQPNNMSKPALCSRQVNQNGTAFHPSPNTINLAVEKGAVATNQKVNGKLLPSHEVTKNGNTNPDHSANNSADNGRFAINDCVASNGLIFSHLSGDGRKMEPCPTFDTLAKVEQIVNHCSADDKFPPSHPLMEKGRKMTGLNPNKELRMNGMLEHRTHTSSKPSSDSVKAKEKVGASMKPPHPDSKYLSQILTIPKGEWPQFDDQEWLFGGKDSQTKRPKLGSSRIGWTKQVWAESIQVESVDLTVMPYVIPY